MTLVDLDGVSARQEWVRFDVLDTTLTKVGEITPARETPARLTNSTGRTIKRTLSGLVLPAGVGTDLDVFGARIRPVWKIEGDSTDYPLGVFLFADRSAEVRSYGEDRSLELVDQTFIIDQPILESISLTIGSNIALALSSLTQDVSVPSVHVDPSAVTVERPLVWPGGTSLYRVLADLCALAGFLPPYFDNDGTLQLVEAPDPATAPATRSYPVGSPIIDPSIITSDDLLEAPNRWVVVDTGATGGPIVGVYELPSGAPNSYLARGFYVTDYSTTQGLMNTLQADLTARAIALTSGTGLELASFMTACDPRHDTFDVVEWGGRRWLETGWDVTLVAGSSQAHSMEALYDAD